MLDLYLGRYKPDSFFIRVWLFFKGPMYTYRREALKRRRAKERGVRLIRRTVRENSVFLNKTDFKDAWAGAYIEVPLKYGETDD